MSHLNIKSLVSAILLSQCAMAQSSPVENEFKSLAAQQAAAQLKRVINDKLQQIIALEVAAGADVNEIEYALQQNAQSSHERFGALLSANNKGLILSITPNSPASKLGLMSGDVIVNVNHISLNNQSLTDIVKQHYASNANPITINVERDSRSQTLSGDLSSLMTPAWTLAMGKITSATSTPETALEHENNAQCGRLVVGKFMPREKTDIIQSNAVVITAIDGVKQRFSAKLRGSVVGLDAVASSGNKNRFKLPTGKHTITVSPRVAYQPEESLHHHSDVSFSEQYEFTIDIASNTSYYLVYDTRKNSAYTNTNMPVVWQTKSQKCQL